MKRIIFIFLITISVFAGDTKAQAVPDTLAYLQTIVNNKGNYVGQPFSVLLNQMPIQIKYFIPLPGSSCNRYKECVTSFSFYFPQNSEQKNLTYPRLDISWQTPNNQSQSLSLYFQLNGAFDPIVSSYYSSGLISDIKLRE